MQNKPCPCGSDKPYVLCCEPLHLGERHAVSAAELMRSRFCAFYVGCTDYIVATTLPAQQPLIDRQALNAWADEMRWSHLQIISERPKIGKRHAQVHFHAYYYKDADANTDAKAVHDAAAGLGVHDELSAFVSCHHEGVKRWYFLDPTLPVSLGNKQPCLCGSDEKFKACCGKFLY